MLSLEAEEAPPGKAGALSCGEGPGVRRNPWLVFFVALLGAILGNLLADAIHGVPIIGAAAPMSFGPVPLNLYVLTLSLGISFKLTVLGIVGLVVALWLMLRD